MILRRLPLMRAPLLLALATPVLLTACWLPPKEIIKEKAAARKAWRAQEKQRKQLRKDIPMESARIVERKRLSPLAPPTTAAVAPIKSGKGKKAKDAAPSPTRQMGRLTPVEGVANMVSITRPTSPLAVSAPWQDGVTPALLTRIDGWQARFEGDKAAAVAGGDGIQIAKQGRLFETDAAMLYGMIPPGLYDCRLVQINTAGPLWHEGQSGKCRVFSEGDRRRISFITTQEVILGQLQENDGFSSIYLGDGMAVAMGALTVGTGPEIGIVQRIADTRWRIILPLEGNNGSAVVEITRPRLAE